MEEATQAPEHAQQQHSAVSAEQHNDSDSSNVAVCSKADSDLSGYIQHAAHDNRSMERDRLNVWCATTTTLYERIQRSEDKKSGSGPKGPGSGAVQNGTAALSARPVLATVRESPDSMQHSTHSYRSR